MSTITENARQQLEEARSAANDAAQHAQSHLSILYQHYLKAQMEMVRGVNEVLEHEMERVEKSAKGQDSKSGGSSSKKS
jgi:hypothetical protein